MADYWIYTSERRDPIPLTGVTDVRRVKLRMPNGKYRDGAEYPVGTAAGSSASASVADLPVRATSELTGTAGIITNVAALVSDEALNIPPRQDWQVKTGYALALNGAVIPSPRLLLPEELGRPWPQTPVSMTVDTTTNVLTAATYHHFVSGDTVVVAGTALPSPADAVTTYTVQRTGELTLLLRTGAGAIVDFTTAGMAVTLSMVKPAPRQLPPFSPVTVTIATELFTVSINQTNRFVTGDVVTLVAATAGTGATVNTQYRILAVSVAAGDYQLTSMTTGAIVAVAGVWSGVSLTMDIPYVPSDDGEVISLDGVSNVLFYSDDVVSLVSNVDPNA